MLISGVLRLRGQERTSRRFRAGASARSAAAVGKKCAISFHTLAPAKPHCCGKALNATSAREVGDGVVAQSGR
jgi:hypothetical protein